MARFAAVAGALLGVSAGFPVSNMEVSKDEFTQMSGTGFHDVLATKKLLPHLQAFFKGASAGIIVEPGDIVVNHAFSDVTIDNACHHTISLSGGHCGGDVKNSSYLEGGVRLSWNSATVFVDAELDSSLDIGGNVRVEVGQSFGGDSCTHLAHKTAGLDVKSDGKNGVGINMTANNAHVEHEDGTWYLAFNFHADVVGRVLQWNVDKITANGCKLEILKIPIISVCGFIEKEVRQHIQPLMDHVTKIDAPKILQKLQNQINTKVGSKVRIPLKLPWMVAEKATECNKDCEDTCLRNGGGKDCAQACGCSPPNVQTDVVV